MHWKLCIDTVEKRALNLCSGSMNKGNGYGSCCGSGYGDGYGHGYSIGHGDGYSYGYGDNDGDGSSPQEWR